MGKGRLDNYSRRAILEDAGGRLSPPEAKRVLRDAIGPGGELAFTTHARREMAKDGLESTDVTNVLRGGIVDEPEWENGAWRYRVRTRRIAVIVELRSDKSAVVVTAWRAK
ncbi:MAG: DUF4258 domain-containing protein [Myxococcota bacterium]|nr:DUF4258 domain-containing protein [Myxococcota bacterium]